MTKCRSLFECTILLPIGRQENALRRLVFSLTFSHSDFSFQWKRNLVFLLRKGERGWL